MGMLKELLEEEFSLRSTQDPLKGLRAQGWERFQALGLPQKRAEAFRYLPLTQLYGIDLEKSASSSKTWTEVEPHIYPECKDSCLVFIDGKFFPELSHIPKEIIVLPLKEALHTYGHFLQNRWFRSLEAERDPFAALNAALHTEGLFLYVPPKIQLSSPLQLLQIVTTSSLISPRIHLFVGAHAGVNWISTLIEEGEKGCLVNSALDVALEEGAFFSQVQVQTELSDRGWYFDAMRATLKRSSQLQSISLSKGAKSLRQSCQVSLLGEGAEALLHGLSRLSDSRQAHTHVLMEHRAPHCRSMQLFKGILDGKSQSSFEGKIFVEPEAQKTEAYQLNKTLLLGEHAMANSKPNLEIFADDVKASHGATVAQVDEEQLFYLKTRGIPEEAAKRLLVAGFAQEILDKIPEKFLRETLKGSL